jgi:hypothetical protein
VDEPEDYKKWCAEQKPFLAMNPAYLEKVPANLKAKASKYIPAICVNTPKAKVIKKNRIRFLTVICVFSLSNMQKL